MEKLRPNNGGKNIIADQLKALRNQCGLSQRDLAGKLQLAGLNFDKNIITRIETSNRFVNDFELKSLLTISVYPILICLMEFQRLKIWKNIPIYFHYKKYVET